MLKDLNVGKDGSIGISILEMPRFRIWGIENPSNLSNPARGDWRASLGSSSDEELELTEDDDGGEDIEDAEDEDDDDDSDDNDDDDVEWPFRGLFWFVCWSISSILELICCKEDS